MIGTGTLVNTAAILMGGLVGMVGGRRLSERAQKTVVAGLSMAVMFVGVAGTLQEMLRVGASGRLVSHGALMLVVSLALGAVLGEWWDLDARFESLGAWLRRVTHNERDGTFVEAFVTASLTFCIGAMAIVGSIEDGLRGDASVLYLKSVMDGVFTVIMVASIGRGAIFAAVPIFVFQGAVTLLARLVAPIFSAEAMGNLSYVGNLLIFAVGWNLIHGEKKVRVANLLPSLLVAYAWSLVPWPS